MDEATDATLLVRGTITVTLEPETTVVYVVEAAALLDAAAELPTELIELRAEVRTETAFVVPGIGTTVTVSLGPGGAVGVVAPFVGVDCGGEPVAGVD